MPLRLKDTLSKLFGGDLAVQDLQKPLDRRTSPRRPAYQTALIEWQDVEKGDQAVAGRLENRSKNGFGIRVPRPIAKDAMILITPEDEAPVKAIVRHCSASEEGWLIGVELIRHDKRRDDRQPMYRTAKVTCTRKGRRADFTIVIRDANENGLQIESPEALAVNQLIEISHIGASREGMVVHCEPAGDRYRVGVQFIGRAHLDAEPPVN